MRRTDLSISRSPIAPAVTRVGSRRKLIPVGISMSSPARTESTSPWVPKIQSETTKPEKPQSPRKTRVSSTSLWSQKRPFTWLYAAITDPTRASTTARRKWGR